MIRKIDTLTARSHGILGSTSPLTKHSFLHLPEVALSPSVCSISPSLFPSASRYSSKLKKHGFLLPCYLKFLPLQAFLYITPQLQNSSVRCLSATGFLKYFDPKPAARFATINSISTSSATGQVSSVQVVDYSFHCWLLYLLP